MTAKPQLEIDPNRTYLRGDGVLSEALDDERVLMHQTTLKVVMLNPVAAVLWDAMQWPMSLSDLVDLQREAHPDASPENVLASTRETLLLLLENGLIQPTAAVVTAA